MVIKRNQHLRKISALVLVSVCSFLIVQPSWAGQEERAQAKRIHERLTGLPPTEETLLLMETQILADGGHAVSGSGVTAALNVMSGVYGSEPVEGFLGGTLKRMAAPWTNRDQDPFADFNDYIATFIGIVKDDLDYRQILSGDIIYHYPSVSPGYSNTNNQHYENIEAQAVPLSGLEQTTQSSLTGLPSAATAGVMTTRAAAKSFFILGTNRAMLRFTLMSQLCRDLEQMEDNSGIPDRIRQDVSRSPGGDSRLFLEGCVGCHIGMDPLAQAFAYYNYEENPDGDPDTDDREDGFIEYFQTPQPNPELGIDTRVQPKYHINAANFPYGYVTPDDGWDNYWREGSNRSAGWDYGNDSPGGSGSGAKSMGRELANSYAFAQCQVKKVFIAVCLRDPATLVDKNDDAVVVDGSDAAQVATMTDNFRTSGYNMKQVFAETADYCKEGN